uniref:Thymosin beta n=1 Tax=Timema tahoe TaxID=61484 RepID=A0A7R9FFQ8_9NEOP|nr:unnamed protein product [Timema tahoe]
MSNPVSPSVKDLPKVSLDLKSELEGFKATDMKKTETQEKIVLPTAEAVRGAKSTRTSHDSLAYLIHSDKTLVLAPAMCSTSADSFAERGSPTQWLLMGTWSVHHLTIVSTQHPLSQVLACKFECNIKIIHLVIALSEALVSQKAVLPMMGRSDVRQERRHSDLIQGVESFSTDRLKRTNTNEKIVLPNAEDVATEKNQKALLQGVEAFDTGKLKHTETQEKNPLPDKDVVKQEKDHQNLLEGVEHFDKTTMKHTKTEEKNPLPNPEAIEQEKGQINLISGIENFDTKKLKHTQTQEKNPLPTKEGN